MHVLVTGGTGFVGRRLTARLRARGNDVTVVSREPGLGLGNGVESASWESVTDDSNLLGRVDAIVNLAGEPVAQRWTDAAKARIVSSRQSAIEKLAKGISKAKRAPTTVVNASAVGYYGNRGSEELTEESAPGTGFLAETTVAWEAATKAFEDLGLRTVRVRIGVVLGKDGGALGKMLLPFRMGLGGPVGSGDQFMSFIGAEDLVSLLVYALDHGTARGSWNGTAPNPVTMDEFVKTLGAVLGRPAVLPVPSFALKLALGEMAAILLEGQRVLPKRPLAAGFTFAHPTLRAALESEIS